MRYAVHEFMPCFIWMYCMDAMVSLANFIAVGNHFEAQSQEFGSSFTHEHTLKENFEIIHNGTNRFIQFNRQGNILYQYFGGVRKPNTLYHTEEISWA